jgi:predicted ribosomally synthesized peptide with nif11-like leader
MNNIEQFFQEVSQDPTLKQQLHSLENREARLNKMVELGQEKGYNFTPFEVEQWLQNRSKELSESELESVAGGQQLSNQEQMTEISNWDEMVSTGDFSSLAGWKFG